MTKWPVICVLGMYGVLRSFAQAAPSSGDFVAKVVSMKADPTMYGLLLTNNSDQTLEFQAVPDIAYQHLACTYNTIFPFTVYYGDSKYQWKPQPTFISGVQTSGEHSYKGTTFLLKPKQSLCAGWWWSDPKALRSVYMLKMEVCTSFHPGAQCFSSEPFHPHIAPEPSGRRSKIKTRPKPIAPS